MPSSSNEVSSSRLPGLVYTFYSYKGGVGRSMALVNVGVLMAMEGYRVLLVDWDLEAPGLEVYFRKAAKLASDPATTAGIVDLLEAHAAGKPLEWRDCLLKAEFFGKSLEILSAGRRTEDYRSRVQQLDWDTLFRDHRIGNYINSLREEWRKEYDFILVDSRTGITDIGDICTVILPDVLVLLFVTNYQNVEGIKNVMARAVKARSKLPVNRNKLLGVPVPTRDERDRESGKFEEWKHIFAQEFGDLYREWLPKEVQPGDALHRIYVPYVAGWSFGERIPVIESERERNDPSSLGASYARVATLLSHRLDWAAIEGRVTVSEAANARVELSKAREEVKEAEMRRAEEAKRREEEVRIQEERRLEAEKQLAQIKASARRARLIGYAVGILLFVAAVGGGWWWYAHPSAERLVARFTDNRPEVRADAVQRLGYLGRSAVPFAENIAKMLKDSDSSVRTKSAMAIGQLAMYDRKIAAQYGADAVPILLKGDTWFSRHNGFWLLSDMGDERINFAPQVAELLKDQDAMVREDAAKSLGEMGKEAVEYAPQLQVLLKDEKASVRKAAASALKQLGIEDKYSYTVRSGDTLAKIAEAHGITVKSLRDLNGLENSQIKVGQVLKVASEPVAEIKVQKY